MKKKILISIFIIFLLIIVVFGIHIYNNKKVLDQIEIAISDMLSTGNYGYQLECSDGISNLSKFVYNNKKTKYMTENVIYYVDVEKDLLYLVDLENTQYTIMKASEVPITNPKTFMNMPQIFNILINKINEEYTDSSYIKALFMMNVSTDTVNGEECYKIEIDNYVEWFSKKALLPVKLKFAFEDGTEIVYDYIFSVNTVKESDVLFNDIDNYEIYVNE